MGPEGEATKSIWTSVSDLDEQRIQTSRGSVNNISQVYYMPLNSHYEGV